MTKEKRLEALAWLIEQADANVNGLAGIDFGASKVILNAEPQVLLFGNGFGELARAASQTVQTQVTPSGNIIEYFMFDGVKFYDYVMVESDE